MPILFDYHINYLSDTNNQTKLPFSVFAMTQQGLLHQSQSIGNQDAACVYVGKNVMMGAVADGCTSGANLNGKSSNQVGAHLMSYLAVRVARKLIQKNHIPLEDFIPPFQQALIGHFKKIMNAINPWKNERNEIIKNLFASTLITFIITQDQFLILNCGDGDIFINEEKQRLQHQSGRYFANNLIDLKFNQDTGYSINPDFQINCLKIGNSIDLNNLLIATDGLIDDDITDTPGFNHFFFHPSKIVMKPGFTDRKTEFRKNLLDEIATSKNGRLWPLDDATFISLKRTI